MAKRVKKYKKKNDQGQYTLIKYMGKVRFSPVNYRGSFCCSYKKLKKTVKKFGKSKTYKKAKSMKKECKEIYKANQADKTQKN